MMDEPQYFEVPSDSLEVVPKRRESSFEEFFKKSFASKYFEAKEYRRAVVLSISPELLLDLLKSGKHLYEIVERPLPEDVKLIRMRIDWQQNVIDLYLESESFEPVAPGASLPFLLSPQIKHIRGEVYEVDSLAQNRKPSDN